MSQYVWVGRNKDSILDVFYDSKGKKHKRSVKFKPSCFIESNNSNTKVRTIYGKSTQQINFDSIRDYQNYVSKNKKIVHGSVDPVIQYINKTYTEDDVYIKLKVLGIDIEVVSSDGSFPYPNEVKHPVNCVSINSFKEGIYYQLSLKDYDKTKNKIDIDPDKIRFKKCQTEVELLRSLIKIIQYEFPDVLIGWNSNGFDFPYIINRCEKVLGKVETSNLSPFGRVNCREIQKKNKTTHSFEVAYINQIDGIILLDYLELYKKYIFTPRESYKLDFIATEELGDGKVDYTEFDNLNQMWQISPQKYTDYNIVDTKLIKELDDKLGLIELNAMITYKARCNHTDSLGTIKPWESFLYNEMLRDNLCLPIRKIFEKESYPGAYVKEPRLGIYHWVVSFDFNSLYPTVIRQYNISPETFIENKTIDVNQEEIDERFFDDNFRNTEDIVTGSGNFFRKDKIGIIPTIVEKLFNERKKVKYQQNELEKELELIKNLINEA